MAFLKWEDYVVIIITVAMSLGMGLYQSLRSNKIKTTSQYIMGDGKMAILPVALSLLVSFQSGISMLGLPAEVYLYGMQIYIGLLGEFVADVFCMYVFVPRLKTLHITSIYEYLEMRYDSHGIRIFGTIMNILNELNYMGTVLLMPAVTLKAVAGISLWTSIIGMMVVVLIYTLIGGFKAVIWSDVIQSVLLFGGVIAVLIKGTIDAGGLAPTWRTVYETGRLNLFMFDIDPTVRQTFWSLVVGSAIRGLGKPFLQTSYLRIKATPNIATSQRMYFITALLCMFLPLLSTAAGGVMFAYYHKKGCDPLMFQELDNSNQLMAYLVTDIFQDIPCLPGLYLAALFCASLSTLSSLLSSSSSVFWEDIVRPHTKPMTDRKGVSINQFAGLCFGIISVVIAFIVSKIEGPVIQIFDTTSSCFSGAITGIFLLGWFVPWANKLGAVAVGATSVMLVGWITLGKLFSSGIRRHSKLEPAPIDNCLLNNITNIVFNTTYMSTQVNGTNVTFSPEYTTDEPYGLDVLYSLSFRWLSPIGIITVLLVGAVVSRFKGEVTIAPELVVPVCDIVCCCVPYTFRSRLHCSKTYHNPNALQENQNENEITGIDLDQMPVI